MEQSARRVLLQIVGQPSDAYSSSQAIVFSILEQNTNPEVYPGYFIKYFCSEGFSYQKDQNLYSHRCVETRVGYNSGELGLTTKFGYFED